MENSVHYVRHRKRLIEKYFTSNPRAIALDVMSVVLNLGMVAACTNHPARLGAYPEFVGFYHEPNVLVRTVVMGTR